MTLNSIPSIELIHSFVTIILSMVCLLMGVTLLVFNIPDNETSKAYRTSVKILSYNYLLLSLLVFGMFFFNLRNNPDETFPFPILLISTIQGLLLPYVLLSLYSPDAYNKKIIFKYIVLPLAVLITLYVIYAGIAGDPTCDSIPYFFSQLHHPTILIRFLLLLFIIYQIVFFTILLKKLSARYVTLLNQYYSDTISLKPKWVKKNFYFAIVIGISSIVSNLFKDFLLDTVFTIVFCLYYFLFAILYIQYKHFYLKLEPTIIQDMEGCNLKKDEVNDERQFKKTNWEIIKKQMIEQKIYLQPGVTVSEMAKQFNTNRTTFSTLLNRNEGQNFNAFINQLRIEHAKHLMIKNPEVSIAEIAHQCGFSEQSNFTRQFKLLCNETPAAWLRQMEKQAKI